MALLEVERVSKGFGGVRAVHDVSFTLAAGELVGIMGPNGSGKTTLFNLIAGALAPDGGAIRFHDRDIAGLAPHRICARGIARTFQLVRPFAGLTALENVLVGRLYGRAREIRLSSGTPNAIVLPDPVGARPHTSRPALTSGMVAAWISNGLNSRP